MSKSLQVDNMLFETDTLPMTTIDSDNNPLIDLRSVWKSFQTPAGRFDALKGISLSIDPGEFVSIIGKSGSGKTTLINLIAGIDNLTSGEILVGGTPVHNLNEGQMAIWRGRTLGIVFQFFQLLPSLTVMENVVLPMGLSNLYTRTERYERAAYLLDLVDLSEQANSLPNKLSGGQQQRAAIARAMANDPPIIATDEPTGNLDTQSANAVLNLFENLVAENKTILMVTHDRDLAKRAGRTIALADGEIIN
jgi:putative ABC transport system ATP-binding protein